MTTQEASDRSRHDPLPTQKNGQKNFIDQKMVKMGLSELSAPPKSTFWGGVVKIFSTRAKWVSKLSEKFFDGA